MKQGWKIEHNAEKLRNKMGTFYAVQLIHAEFPAVPEQDIARIGEPFISLNLPGGFCGVIFQINLCSDWIKINDIIHVHCRFTLSGLPVIRQKYPVRSICRNGLVYSEMEKFTYLFTNSSFSCQTAVTFIRYSINHKR